MEHAEQAIQQGQGDCEDGARDVVGLAHDSITWQGEQEGAVILGSSTICLGLMRPGGLLEMANVGDSGFRVVRGNETLFASEVGAASCPSTVVCLSACTSCCSCAKLVFIRSALARQLASACLLLLEHAQCWMANRCEDAYSLPDMQLELWS